MRRSLLTMKTVTVSAAVVVGSATVASACPATRVADASVAPLTGVSADASAEDADASRAFSQDQVQAFYDAKLAWAGKKVDYLAAQVASLASGSGATLTPDQHERAAALAGVVRALRAGLAHIPTTGDYAATAAQQATVAALQTRLSALADGLAALLARPVAAPVTQTVVKPAVMKSADVSGDHGRWCDHTRDARYASWGDRAGAWYDGGGYDGGRYDGGRRHR